MVTRIRKLLEQKQLTPTQFADLIGVGRPVMSHILSERNKPSLEVVQRIIGAFPELSIPWLLSGSGEMLAGDAAAPAIAPNTAAEGPSPSVVSNPPAEQHSQSDLPPIPTMATVADMPLPHSNLAKEPTLTAPPVLPQAPDGPPDAPATIAPVANAERPVVSQLMPNSSPASTLASAPLVPKPFRASRMAAPPPTAPTVAPVAAISSPTNAAEPAAATALTPAPVVTPAVTAPHASDAATLSFLAEPGKAIRRIVIFYRDGSFTDYQPEQ